MLALDPLYSVSHTQFDLILFLGFSVFAFAGGGAAFGAVLGAIFSKLNDKMPSRSSFVKCLILYSVLWIICQAVFIQQYWGLITSYMQYPRMQEATFLLEFPLLSFLIVIGASFTFTRLFARKT